MKIYLFASILFHIFLCCCFFLLSKEQKKESHAMEISLIYMEDLKLDEVCKKITSLKHRANVQDLKVTSLTKSGDLRKVEARKNIANVPRNNCLGSLGKGELRTRDMIPYESNKNPVYPLIALRNNITGKVMIRINVNGKGDVVNIKILCSPSPILSEATIKVVKNWKFYRTQETNVAVVVPIEFKYE